MKSRNALMAVLALVSPYVLGGQVVETLPEKYIMPCVREIPLTAFTKGIVPVYPMRMVNLTFPFELEKDKTTMALSSDKIWGVKEKFDKGRIIPVYYKTFDRKNWGIVHDLTISTEDHVISLALTHGTEKEHCSNVVFTLSEEEKARLQEQRKERFIEQLQAEYKAKHEALDERVDEEALLLVSGLAEDRDYDRIKEEGELVLSNGDELVVYVKEIQKFGKFQTLRFYIENNGSAIPVYNKSVQILRKGQSKAIKGVVDLPKKTNSDQVQEVVFATLEVIPVTDGRLVLETDQGKVEVVW